VPVLPFSPPRPPRARTPSLPYIVSPLPPSVHAPPSCPTYLLLANSTLSFPPLRAQRSCSFFCPPRKRERELPAQPSARLVLPASPRCATVPCCTAPCAARARRSGRSGFVKMPGGGRAQPTLLARSGESVSRNRDRERRAHLAGPVNLGCISSEASHPNRRQQSERELRRRVPFSPRSKGETRLAWTAADSTCESAMPRRRPSAERGGGTCEREREAGRASGPERTSVDGALASARRDRSLRGTRTKHRGPSRKGFARV